MKKISIFFAALICSLAAANAQSVSSLQVTPDARSAGMGDTGVALTRGAFSIFHNPATMSFCESRSSLGYTYSPWGEQTIHSVGGYYRINDRHAIGAGFRYFGFPTTEGFDENGNPTGELKRHDMAAELGYSFAINNNFSIAANLRFVNSSLPSKTGTAFVGDIGGYFNSNGWSAGLVVSNVGSQLSFDENNSDVLPGKVKIGGGYSFLAAQDHRFTFALDAGYRFQPSDTAGAEAGVGIEYLLMNMIAVRGGAYMGDIGLNHYIYGTFGIGVRYSILFVDFSYLLTGSSSPVKNTFRISGGLVF